MSLAVNILRYGMVVVLALAAVGSLLAGAGLAWTTAAPPAKPIGDDSHRDKFEVMKERMDTLAVTTDRTYVALTHIRSLMIVMVALLVTSMLAVSAFVLGGGLTSPPPAPPARE
jgi:hypothetical protein